MGVWQIFIKLEHEEADNAITFVKTLEVEDENTMSPHLFAEIVVEAYQDKIQGAAVLDSLAVVADIRSRGEKDRNGTTE